jgi:hypothetical protein
MFMMKKIKILLIGLMLTMPCSVFAQNYVYGDVNGDGEINIADVNAVVGVILGDHHIKSIVGSWISEYAIDENGERFDIPEQIKVSFDFFEDQSGIYGYSTYYNHNTTIDYIGLKWEQQLNRLYLWFDDGDHEELYYTINDDGYLLLSLNAQLTQYTAYCPVDHDHPLGSGKDSHHSDKAATIKSVSRAVSLGR